MAKEKSKSKSKTSTPASTRPKSSSTLNQSSAVNGTGDVNGSSASSSSAALLSAFSPAPSSTLFAQVSTALDSHAVRIFDTSSGRVVSRWAGNGSSEKVLSLEWVQLAGSAAAKDGKDKPRGKKRRKSSSSGEPADQQSTTNLDSNDANQYSEKQEALALGLTNGSILIIHPSQSTIIQTLSSPTYSTHGITSLSYPESSSNLLWSCSSSGHVMAWSLPALSGEVGSLVARYESAGTGWGKLAVRYTKDQTVQMLVAQHAIKLYEVQMPKASVTEGNVHTEEPKLRATFTGHTTEVSQLSWLSRAPQTENVISSTVVAPFRFASVAHSDRFVNIWQIPSLMAESTVEGVLAATYGMTSDVLRITLPRASSSSLSLITSTAGSAALVDLAADDNAGVQSGQNDKKKQRRNPVATLRALSEIGFKGDDAGMEGITNAKFGGSENFSILLSRSTLRPAFEEVNYRDANGSILPELGLKKSKGKGVLLSGENESTVPIHRAAYSETQHSSILPASAAAQDDASVKQQTAPSTTEPTLAERLHGLQMETADLTVRGDVNSDLPSEKTTGQPSRKNTARRIADATSLSSSLVQALHSTDVRLVESCLAQTDPRVVRSTVQRIPNVLVLPLVEVLVERLGRSSAKGFGGAGSSGNGGVDAHRGHELLLWLRHVLLVHLGYLVTVPELVRKLANLHATLENRMNFHDQLLSLNGRLDLVVSQIDAKTTANGRRPLSKDGPSGQIQRASTSAAGPSRYVEGEEGSAESDSEEESDEDDEEEDEMEAENEVIGAAEEGSDAEIEDLVMGTNDDGEDAEDVSEDEEDQVLSIADRKQKLKKASKRMKKADKQKNIAANLKANGFLDVEADEGSEDEEGDDNDELGLNGYRSFVAGDGEGSEDDDSEDQDAYESDFINDDEEEEEEESDDE